MKEHRKEDERKPHYVDWTDNTIKEYWDVYQTHPDLFRKLICIHGTNINPTLDTIVNKACKLVPRKSKILDIGFGNGYVIKKMALKGYECYGVDISEKNVSETQKEIYEDNKVKDKKITLKTGSILQLSMIFGSDLFDFIIATDVFEHINNETLHNGLQEISLVLKKNGCVFISTPYKEVLERSYILCPECYAIFHMVGHLQSFDEKRMINILKQHNFHVTECTTDTKQNDANLRLTKIYDTLLRILKISSPETRAYTKNLQTIAQKI